jgi:DNA-binding transcriptional ArsR family regulator
MGLSKTEEFTKVQNELAGIAKAIAHPARIAILQFLIKSKSCVCGDIVDELPLSQSTVSQHLSELKKAGLINGEIDGPSVCYCIDEKAWMKAKKVIGELFETYEGKIAVSFF